MASFFFRVFIDLKIVSLHKKGRKELGQYPVILTSGSVNNAFIAVSLLQPATCLKFTSRHWNGFLTHASIFITLAWRDFFAIIEKNGKFGTIFSLKYHDEFSYSTTKHKFKEVSEDSKNSRNQEITLLSTNYNFEYLTFCRRAFSSHWLTFKVYFLVFHFLSFIYSSSRSIYFFVQDPKPLEVYSADFVIDGPQLGFLGNVSSSFPFSLFF